MEFLLSGGNTLTLVFICAGLCVAGMVILFIFQFLGGIFATLLSVLQFGIDILSGGPVAWCGCLVGILACCGVFGGIVFFLNVARSCGTPDAVNFCRLLGY